MGTLLDRDNPAYEALLQKQSYEGPVTLFGHRYEARYAPLLDAGGQLEGALMVCVRREVRFFCAGCQGSSPGWFTLRIAPASSLIAMQVCKSSQL